RFGPHVAGKMRRYVQGHPIAGRHGFPERGGAAVDEHIRAAFELARKAPGHAQAAPQHVGQHAAIVVAGDDKLKKRPWLASTYRGTRPAAARTLYWLVSAHTIASRKSHVRALPERSARGAAPAGHAKGVWPARN